MDKEIVVKIPLDDYIVINEKVRRYDRIMDAIERRKSLRSPRNKEMRSDGCRIR